MPNTFDPDQLSQLSPKEAARQVNAAQPSAWLDAFTEHLDNLRISESLARTLRV